MRILLFAVFASLYFTSCSPFPNNDEKYQMAASYLAVAQKDINKVDSIMKYEDPKYWRFEKLEGREAMIQTSFKLAEEQISAMDEGEKRSELMTRFTRMGGASYKIATR